MPDMKPLRIIKAFSCGLGAGGILLCGMLIFRFFIHQLGQLNFAYDLPEDSMPPFTKFFNALTPHHEATGLVGLLLFTVGYGWLALIKEPSSMICLLHCLLAFVFVSICSAIIPTARIVQGIIKSQSTPIESLWSEWLHESPWLVVCCAPMIVAVITCRRRKVLD